MPMVPAFGWQELAEVIAAVGGLGTAAVGLVDATKAFGGGVSNRGWATLAAGLRLYGPAFRQSIGEGWEEVFKSGWLNGRSRADQLVMARNFIRLGLSEATAEEIARVSVVDPARLKAVARKITSGLELTPAEFELVGRMDAGVEARLGAAYDRAEQRYRNTARVAAGAVAVLLALAGWALVLGADLNYLGLALLAGATAVPVAPLVKDLVSSLSASAQAMKALKTIP